MIKRGLIVLLGLALAQGASGALQPFGPDAFSELKVRYASEPVLVLLWSVDCQHCKEGMARAATVRGEHPELNLVIVNVDAGEDAAEVERILDALALSDADNWQFVEAPAARLRATIDPEWYGELPRSYLIDANGNVEGFSGRLLPEFLEYWRQSSDADQ